MHRLRAELIFIRALIAINWSSAMEYRAGFISQIVGMFLNNGVYFIFWIIFFDQFGGASGYDVQDIFLLFGVVATGFGLADIFAANTGYNMAYLIAQGRLDYYLALPRVLLLHVICSRMSVSALGDLAFGLFAFALAGWYRPIDFLLFGVAAIVSALIFVAFGILTGSLAFYFGSAQQVSRQATSAMLTFALYPGTLFSGASRFLLYTLIPAGFVGAMPVSLIQGRDPILLAAMIVAAVVFWVLAIVVFYAGLRRYESGSALNVNV
jgi:ABC-2 type transport system permease protein